MRLEIGSGEFPDDGYDVHVDILTLPGVAVVCAMDRLPFRDGCPRGAAGQSHLGASKLRAGRRDRRRMGAGPRARRLSRHRRSRRPLPGRGMGTRRDHHRGGQLLAPRGTFRSSRASRETRLAVRRGGSTTPITPFSTQRRCGPCLSEAASSTSSSSAKTFATCGPRAVRRLPSAPSRAALARRPTMTPWRRVEPAIVTVEAAGVESVLDGRTVTGRHSVPVTGRHSLPSLAALTARPGTALPGQLGRRLAR